MRNPTLILLVLACLFYANLGTSQTFPPFNLALDDSCTHAPFFCEGALSTLSTNNINGTANGMDTLTGCAMENTVWLSFTTCEDSVQLDFIVDSCSLGNGLEFTLFDTDDCINYTIVGSPCRTILDQTTSSLSFYNLLPGQTYTLAIDGINGDFCSFAIDTTFGIYMPSIGSAPDSDFEIVVTEAAYIIPPAENCPSGDYIYVPPVCELQPANCSGGPPPTTTCAIEYDICKLDPGTYIYPAYIYTTRIQWNYPDCAIVTGDTLSNIINIDISECLADYISTLTLPPPPPMDTFPPDVPIAQYDFSYGANIITTRVLDTMNIDTVVITDGGITYCPNCSTGSVECGECIGQVDDNGSTPIYYCQEDIEVCPECSNGNCPGDFEYEIEGCKINAKLYIPTDPQDEYLGQFFICPGECLNFGPNVFCGEGFYSYQDFDADGCEIEISLELVILQYPPFIIGSTVGSILTCDNPCTTIEVQAIDADFYDWGGFGNSASISVCGPGSYTCEVYNSCGSESVTIFVVEDINIPNIDITASVPTLTIDMDSSELLVNHSGSGANLVFEWSYENNASFSFNNPIIVTEPGNYSVTVTNVNNGCTSEADIEIFENVVSIDETPIGSDCSSAPLFCSDFLVDFNTDNENGQPDSTLTLDCPVDNAVWLQFVACDSVATFSFDVDSCTQAQGLEFSIVTSEYCTNASSVGNNCIPVTHETMETISFDSLSADSIYYLVIDGIGGDICNLNIDALSGVMNSGYGDTLNPSDTINYRLELIAPGSIDGPTEICAFAPTTFTFIPGVCGLIEGDCNRATSDNQARVYAEPCDLPFAFCFGDSFETDTIVDWDIPNGIDIIGDSTDFDITIEPSLDWILDQYNGMIPASDTDTIVITLYADYSIVPINDSLNSDSTTVYCHCPSSGIVCGSCDTGASLDVSIIVIFNSITITDCNPDCMPICDGQVLCPGESAYCTEPCILTTWSLEEIPPQVTSYQETVCEGECAQTPYGEFCPGSYSEDITDCLIVQITITEQPSTVIFPEETICPGDCIDIGSMTFCTTGLQTWTDSLNGCLVNYSVEIFEYNTDPVDYGSSLLCEGECLDINGNVFCTPGIHNFTETSPDGCTIDATVELIWESSSLSIGPVTELCNAAGDEFNVSFSIFGDPPFTVNGVEIASNFFTSDYYDDGANYFFEIKDPQSNCPSTEIVAGAYYCPLLNCDSDPGMLNIKNESFCSSNSLVVEEVTAVYISTDDFTSEYVLHEGVDPFSNPILMRNESGIFTYNTSLDYGTQYSVSRIVGEKLGGTETVNITGGQCLEFAQGPTVTFYSEPVLAMNPIGDLHLDCNQPEVLLTAETSGGSSSHTTSWTMNGLNTMGSSIDVTEAGTITIELLDVLTSCSTQTTVEVTADFEKPVFTLEAPEILDCLVKEVAVLADINDMGSQLQLEWSGPFGTLPLGNNPTTVNSQEAGWHYLNIVNEVNGCATLDSIEVKENENLPETFDLNIAQPICADDPIGSMDISNVQGGTAPYNYYINDMTFLGEMENLNPGIYEIEIIDQKGCSISDEFEITAPTPLESNLLSEITVTYGEQIQLDPNLNFTPSTVEWLDEASQVLGITEFLNIVLDEDQSIRFTALDMNGCEIEQSILIRVKQPDEDIYAPSAFSPNGDLVNDFYELYAANNVAKIDQLVIFDRWGNLVFKADNYLPGDEIGQWDGKLDGKKLNPAVFVFRASYTLINGKEIKKTGDIALLR